jgi:hypothetical protein
MMTEKKKDQQPKADEKNKSKDEQPKAAKPVNRGRTFSGSGTEKRG